MEEHNHLKIRKVVVSQEKIKWFLFVFCWI